MKNSVLLTFMMLFASAGIISAQPNPPDYYAGKTRIVGDGYVYNIKHSYFSNNATAFGLIIQNELNTIINTKPPQLPENLWWMTASVKSKETENYFMSIAAKEIKELYQESKKGRSESQETRFGNDLSAMIAVNPRTGQILEVYFSCFNTPATRAIHPDKFYQLEQYIKQNINISLDVFDANLNEQNQLRERDWILTKINFKFREMYPL